MKSISDLWVIEARDADGKLCLDGPQPEQVFGIGAIRGMTVDEIAKVILNKQPKAELHGTDIHNWPRLVYPFWKARRKYW